MRAAILTDIHSNLAALEAVLAATDEAGVEQRWCLGDVVGYGAQPDECASLAAERCEICLVGNHDLAVTGEIDTEVFSAAAAAAVEWTQENCEPGTIEFLKGLEPGGSCQDVGLFHASPRDPVWEYVLAVDQAAECMRDQPQRVSLIGHSHVALYFCDGGANGGSGEPGGGQAPAGQTIDVSEGRWLLNPGSVGQPRDGDPRAAWLELDTDSWTATYHRVEYDIDLPAGAIREAGLPELLAERLYVGQ
jgi:diadenosine tetraphosphatase ApaH/serine/threonine PP2A family protein phosphatase